MRIAAAALVALLATGCEEQVTPGQELMGTWASIAQPDLEWTFREDLTYVMGGARGDRGTYELDGTWLHYQSDSPVPVAMPVAFDLHATRDHWLAYAQVAVGDTSGRLGTWRGSGTSGGGIATLTTTLRADGTAHAIVERDSLGGSSRAEGDGSWADSTDGDNSFVLAVELVEADGTRTPLDLRYWHLGNAIGQGAWERVSF